MADIIVPQGGKVALFDVGATHTRVAVADNATAFSVHETFATDHGKDGWKKLAEAIMKLAGDVKLAGVAGGIAAQIDESGKLFHATNLPAWEGLAFISHLESSLGVRVSVHNDASMVGLGEAIFGAGRGYAIVMYETVSTGVNAARIVDGQIDRSSKGFEAGRELIEQDGRLTTLEAATGGAALERKYGHQPQELRSGGLWRAEAGLLAQGLHNSLVHWSPDIVVFGGSMMRDISVDEIGAQLRKLGESNDTYPPIVRAELGDEGGLYGALALARQLGYVS